MSTPPRVHVSRVLPRRQLDGFYFRETYLGWSGLIHNRIDETEAVVDRAVRIVELAKRGYEVIYETGPSEQSGRLEPLSPTNTQGEPARMNTQ